MLLPIPADAAELKHIFPPERWHLAYFDSDHLILVTEGNRDLKTYTQLYPAQPANVYATAGVKTPYEDAVFSGEIDRCLRDDPDNAWCLLARAASVRTRRGPQGRGDALRDLAEARARLPMDSPQQRVLRDEVAAWRPLLQGS